MNPELAASSSEPSGSSSLVAVAECVRQALVGSVATMVAVLAIASIGFLMLQGRIELRRGATIVLGSFILFGAPAIAAGLMDLDREGIGSSSPPPSPTRVEPPPPSAPPASDYDPYAGATVPVR